MPVMLGSPDGAIAVVSAGSEFGFWTADLNSLEAAELDIEPIRAATDAEGAIVIAGAERQTVAWTSDNELVFVVNLTVPVRVTLETGA